MSGVLVWSSEECFVKCEGDDYCGGVSVDIDEQGKIRCYLHWCNASTWYSGERTFYSRSCPGNLSV